MQPNENTATLEKSTQIENPYNYDEPWQNKEEYAKTLSTALNQFADVYNNWIANGKPKSDINEKIAEWEQLSTEVEQRKEQKMQPNKTTAVLEESIETEEDDNILWTTKEGFARSFTQTLKELEPILLGKQKPVDNFDEKLAEWQKLAEEVDNAKQ